MRFQIQLISERQRSLSVSVMGVPSNEHPQFESVSIEYRDPLVTSGVSFLVQAGRGEALAEALRQAVAP